MVSIVKHTNGCGVNNMLRQTARVVTHSISTLYNMLMKSTANAQLQ